jgi:glycosyltransferase involved in cell wall biosynthesis
MSDITVILIVLNNKENIEKCIESILLQDIFDLIVIDGGSTDGTIEFLEQQKITYFNIGKTGLSHARQFGVDKVTTEFVALVDSDNILESNCLINLRSDLKNSNFVGIAAQKRSFYKDNLFGIYQEWMNSKKVNVPGKKLVIGTPSIYYANVLKSTVRYNPEIKFGDDTDLCYRLSLKNMTVGTGSGICFEKMPKTFNEFYQKAYLYGKADLEFFKNNKSRRHDIGTHALRNYLIKMTYHSLKDFKFYFLPLVFVYSFSRFIGLYYNLIFKK